MKYGLFELYLMYCRNQITVNEYREMASEYQGEPA